MTWWVYKCNSRGHKHQNAVGDWSTFFEEADPERRWGNVEYVPALERLQEGDKILAYQTDRNELVGVACVTRSSERDGYVHMTPERLIRVRVRPLKKADPAIDRIPALKGGPIKTIYEISPQDAELLIQAAGGGTVVWQGEVRR
jgi:hypothetical protein